MASKSIKLSKVACLQTFFEFKNPTHAQKNKYEEVIDEMMKSEVSKRYPDLKEIFDKAYSSNTEKRQAILSVLDKNRGLFYRINKDIGTSIHLDPQSRIAELIVMLRDYIKVGEVERKLYGEVMTPISLVEEMLDGLPEGVWKNPDLKWLDPANGCGIFPAVIVKRLMAGLESWEPNKEKRYKHIMEKMIHVCELQPKNMFLFLCAFDPKDEYALNVYTGSFLKKDFDRHAKEIWGVDKFDLIVGNPPYHDGSGNKGVGHTLWDKFVLKALKILQKKGYLNKVHPSGWRDVDGSFSPVKKELQGRSMLYLEMHDMNDGVRMFNAQSNYDWYVIKNETNPVKTNIKAQDGTKYTLDISKMPFIPSRKFKEITRLLAKGDEEKVTILNSRSAYGADKPHVSKTKNKEYTHPCIYSIKIGDRPTLVYTNTQKNGHFGIPKFIWGGGVCTSIGSIIDARGEFGLTQWATAIIDNPNILSLVKKAFDSKEFKEIMKACPNQNNNINGKVIRLFRKDFWKEFLPNKKPKSDRKK